MRSDAEVREHLQAERARVLRLLADSAAAAEQDRDGANDPGDMTDPAASLTSEGGDEAVVASLQDRLSALERAQARLDAGTYGRSVLSGLPIPDDRLEADPAAELTVEEAAEQA